MENERLNGKKTMGRMEGKEGMKDHRKRGMIKGKKGWVEWD